MYQCQGQGIEYVEADSEVEAPGTPRISRFEASREAHIIGELKQPLPYEQENFCNRVLDFIINTAGSNFNMIESQEFKDICSILNPFYKVPSRDVLQRMLDERVMEQKRKLKEYLLNNVNHGAITADGWMSKDGRKYLGVTYHFVTPDFEPMSVVIGMERASGAQTGEVILHALSKDRTTVLIFKNSFVCPTY